MDLTPSDMFEKIIMELPQFCDLHVRPAGQSPSALMECNVSINFLLAIRQNYSPGTLAFCLIEISRRSGKFLSFAKSGIAFECSRIKGMKSKEYLSRGNCGASPYLNNCVNFVTSIRKLANFPEFRSLVDLVLILLTNS